MGIQYVDQLNYEGKKVIARFDFNVPLAKDGSGKITDTTRIDSALKTIKYILDHGASKLIMMSHLGRPEGKGYEAKYSLEPVAKVLAEKLGLEVVLTESCTDAGIKTLLGVNGPKLILLQNLRFHAEEEANDDAFAKILASYADIYVNDAFGTAHRKHASTYQIVKHFPIKSVACGFLMKQEVESLSKCLENPAAPYIAIVGGAKVSDKIKIIENLLAKVNTMLIGGAMAYPFLKAQGHTVGKSLCNQEDVELAKQILASNNGKKLLLPVDHVVSDSLEGAPEACTGVDIAEGKIGLDIGPKTLDLYKSKLSTAKTVLWNGPMGLFENKAYAKGTFAIASTLAELKGAFTVIGGGDSVSAVNKSGLADKMGHVSTGGGASLEYIENGSLPGVQALKFGVN